MFGNPDTTPVVERSNSMLRSALDRRGEQLKEGTSFIGNQVKVKVVKNKVAAPFKSCVIDIIYGKGISKSGEVVDPLLNSTSSRKSGSWYAYNDQKIGQGRKTPKISRRKS